MSGGAATNTSIRKMISALLLLGLLAFLLSIYFLKYVPDQRNDFHRRAFLELSQIERAIQERNQGYISVINNSIGKIAADSLGNSQLSNYFRFCLKTDSALGCLAGPGKMMDTLAFREIAFEPNELLNDWQLSYLLAGKRDKHNQGTLAIKLDSILKPIVSTYSDIFADYILIADTNTNPAKDTSSFKNNTEHKGRVIFNSGRLSVDYLVNMDTLLRKTDGFSVLNVHDVRIEGNPYKLFLYPILLHNQRIVLAGLISQTRYRQGSEAVPIDLITIGCILILLLLLNLPLLKIYIIGPIERITSLDIRMIIMSYFLAAFMIFFLFFLFFLSRNRTITNESALGDLGEKIQHNFFSEINDIQHQLGQYDTLYAALHLPDSTQVKELLHLPSSIKKPDSLCNFLISGGHLNDSNLLRSLDSLDSPKKEDKCNEILKKILHPAVYPQMDLVFWIDTGGNWAGRWGFKKKYQGTRKINVKDRLYFKDMINHDLLSLPHPYNSPADSNYFFTIQPTLSRVSGDYNVNVVIRSHFASLTGSYNWNSGPNGGKDSAERSKTPVMLGIATEMHSVCNTILPTGYNFSIVNTDGEILYDSKPGRSLLSNFFIEAGDNTDIEQCVHYRYKRFFEKFSLKGREVALLSKPLANLPYTLLVYYNVAITDEFHFHSLCLACFCMACILSLIAITAFFNEWGKKNPTLLSISPVTFDWLRPVPEKIRYYKHQTIWMLKLLMVYGGTWLVVELLFRHKEPALFIISLSFPFFVANHYYVIRERYYLLHREGPPPTLLRKETTLEIAVAFIKLLRLPYFLPLGLVLLIILIYLFVSGFGPAEKTIILSVFMIMGLTILRSSRKFLIFNEAPSHKGRPHGLIKTYTAAILTGVVLITLVPATGLFALFYKEESNSELKMLKLNMARTIQQRRKTIDKKIADYFFQPDDDAFLKSAKFEKGIYFPDSLPIRTSGTVSDYYHTYPGYTELHQLLFSADSTTLEPPNKKDAAEDSSWIFYQNSDWDGLELVYKNQGVTPDTTNMYLSIDPVTQATALGLLWKKIITIDNFSLLMTILCVLVCILIAYLLTGSLARHVFLLNVLGKYRDYNFGNPESPPALESCGSYRPPAPPLLSRGCVKVILTYERQINNNNINEETDILQAHHALEDIYNKVWKQIPTDEKYILYDFALDGFTNYKAGVLLYRLLQKGVLRIDVDLRLEIMSKSFHNYLLSKDIFNKHLLNKEDMDVYLYMKNARKQGSWQAFRVPLHIILAVTGMFIFLTQDALYQKIIGLFASIPSLAQMVSSFFEKSTGKDTVGHPKSRSLKKT